MLLKAKLDRTSTNVFKDYKYLVSGIMCACAVSVCQACGIDVIWGGGGGGGESQQISISSTKHTLKPFDKG